MMPILPFWFKQRQCKAEPHGTNMLKVTGPNLAECYLHVDRADNGLWRAGLHPTPEVPASNGREAEFPDAETAWNAAFEMYRRQFIV
jgi:hypothetical protein